MLISIDPPEGNLETALNIIENKILDITGMRPGDLVLMGDLDIDFRDTTCPMTRKYSHFLKSVNLSQMITDTHVCSTRKSLLDHALTNREELYYEKGRLILVTATMP